MSRSISFEWSVAWVTSAHDVAPQHSQAFAKSVPFHNVGILKLGNGSISSARQWYEGQSFWSVMALNFMRPHEVNFLASDAHIVCSFVTSVHDASPTSHSSVALNTVTLHAIERRRRLDKKRAFRISPVMMLKTHCAHAKVSLRMHVHHRTANAAYFFCSEHITQSGS
jgi:hypothetical protein